MSHETLRNIDDDTLQVLWASLWAMVEDVHQPQYQLSESLWKTAEDLLVDTDNEMNKRFRSPDSVKEGKYSDLYQQLSEYEKILVDEAKILDDPKVEAVRDDRTMKMVSGEQRRVALEKVVDKGIVEIAKSAIRATVDYTTSIQHYRLIY